MGAAAAWNYLSVRKEHFSSKAFPFSSCCNFTRMFFLLCLGCCFYFPSCLKVWLSNRNSKEICPLGERDKTLSVYKVNKQRRKKNLNSFFSLFYLQLQQGAGFSKKCACFKSVVLPLDLKVRLLNFFSPYT